MSRKATQCWKIIEYMKTHGSITPMEAIEHIGCTKLATRISEMIEAGIKINKEMVTGKDRDGQTVRYMRYRLAV